MANDNDKTEKTTTQKRKNNIARVTCLECGLDFGLDVEFMGVVTCPYCGKYFEG